jgi:hypothetical protein
MMLKPYTLILVFPDYYQDGASMESDVQWVLATDPEDAIGRAEIIPEEHGDDARVVAVFDGHLTSLANGKIE